MNTWTKEIPFFAEHELACRGTGVILMDVKFAVALPALRLAWGHPMTLSSCCRTPEYNEQVGGHPRSMHLTVNPERGTNGTAGCDVSWWGWTRSKKIDFCRLAWRMGWSIGLNDAFAHIDRRVDFGLSQNVFTYGDDWTGGWGFSEIAS